MTGTDVWHQNARPDDSPITNASASIVAQDFFKVTSNGTGTSLRLTSGNAVDQAVNGPTARQTFSVNGREITVGIISDSFGTKSEIAQDQNIGALPTSLNVIYDLSTATGSSLGTGEGRAMAEVVHAIAPGATIDFYSNVAGGSPDANLAAAINGLRQQGCQIIVDDVTVPGEPLS